MSKDEILEKLTSVFRDIFEDDAIVLERGMTADDVKEWDSANHINLVVAAEMRFRMKISTAEVDALKNVGDFVDLIERKTSQ
ncbi:MAG: acyl carrier protein [Methylocella sp.]